MPVNSKSNIIVGVIDTGILLSLSWFDFEWSCILVYAVFPLILQEFGQNQRVSATKDLVQYPRNSKESVPLLIILH